MRGDLGVGRIAILGAGIMGTCLAIMLARRGRQVVLFDQAPQPLEAASRWNEGKLHLGYLYGADPSLCTARLMITGGLHFSPLVAGLIGCDLDDHVTQHDDVYLVHRKSVVDADTLQAQFAKVAGLLADHPDRTLYIGNAGRAPRALASAELTSLARTDEVVAGIEVPERSVDTQWLADRLVDALRAEPQVLFRSGVRVEAVRPTDGADGPWRVIGRPDLDEPFALVVNALWEGRLAVDVTAGLALKQGWSHRFRLSIFLRTRVPLDLRSAVLAVGPFGDVKNYNRRSFYLSWYPTGLRAEGSEAAPPIPEPLSPEGEVDFVAEVVEQLGRHLPSVPSLLAEAEDLVVRGGYVFAQAHGSLADPHASIHRRDRFGVRRHGRYISVDTGKYSTAPWLADRLANEICS